MPKNEFNGPAPNLEALERNEQRRAPEEDEGVTFDEELDEKRIIDEELAEGDNTLPSERPKERDTPEQRGSTRVDDEIRGETRKAQYDEGADLVSELD